MRKKRGTEYKQLLQIAVYLVFLVFVQVLCFGAEFDQAQANSILKSTDAARGGGLPGITWHAQVLSVGDGSPQSRELTVKAANNSNVVEFLSPPKVKGQKILMVERNTWFLQPGLQRPVPISPRQRLSGEAANGDVASTNYSSDYIPTPLREEILNNEECYVLDLKAQNKGATYDRIVYWVSKRRRVGVKAEFYTVSGKKFKEATFEYENQIQYGGKATLFVSKMVIVDSLNPSRKTTLAYANVKVGDIPNSEFNVNLLLR